MKTTKILAAAALSLLAVAGASAEEYQGVHSLTSQRSRAELSVDAVAAARAGNVYGEAAGAGVQAPLNSLVSREAMRAQGVAASHDPTWNLDRKAFVNSVVPKQYTEGSLAVRRQQNRQHAGL